jgi:hypothetical protein
VEAAEFVQRPGKKCNLKAASRYNSSAITLSERLNINLAQNVEMCKIIKKILWIISKANGQNMEIIPVLSRVKTQTRAAIRK